MDLLDDASRRKGWNAGKMFQCSWQEVRDASQLKESQFPALAAVLNEGNAADMPGQEGGRQRVEARLMLVQHANQSVRKALPWIDTTRAGTDRGSAASRLASIAHLIALVLKKRLWDRCLEKT